MTNDIVKYNQSNAIQELDLKDVTKSEAEIIEGANQIDIFNNDSILTIGSDSQNELSTMSDEMLRKTDNDEQVKNIDAMLDKLVKKIESKSPEVLEKEPSIFKRMMNKGKEVLSEHIKEFNSINAEVDKIKNEIVKTNDAIQSDNELLEDFFNINRNYYYDITNEIASAELKKDEILKSVIPELEEASQDGSNESFQKLQDAKDGVNTLDKKITDLMSTRAVAGQSGKTIRMTPNMNTE